MSARGVHVERDAEGLKIALREIFEEAFLREASGGMDGATASTMARIAEEMPQRSLSPGYYTRAEYLLDLATAIECGVGYSAEVLGRDDALGLQALKRARNEFERDHPACSCGARQHSRFISQCRRCGAKFQGSRD